MPRVGVNELARLRGVSHPAVIRAEASGRITRRGPDGKFELERAMREWDGATDPSKPLNSVTGDPKMRRGAAGEQPMTYVPRGGAPTDDQTRLADQIQSSRALREYYAALREKQAWERDQGRLIDADELRPALFEVITIATNALRTASSRLIPALGLAATQKPIIDREMEATIATLRKGLTQLQNAKPGQIRSRGRPRKAGRKR